MKYCLYLFIASLLILVSCAGKPDQASEPASNEVLLNKGWKFQLGDSLAYAKPEYDDSGWGEIDHEMYWEHQEYADYHGYAWYRVKAFVPTSIRENAYLRDSITVILGKIDDTDQTFLNGHLIGQNGDPVSLADADLRPEFIGDKEAHQIFRKYTLSVDDPRLLWDQENVIAIRVHDHYGYGGMYSANVHAISMKDVKDYVLIDVNQQPIKLVSTNNFSKVAVLRNWSDKAFKGTFTFTLIDSHSKAEIFGKKQEIDWAPGSTQELRFDFEADQTVGHEARFSFLQQGAKVPVEVVQEVPYILTPFQGDEPRINGPSVYGARPGRPLSYLIPATGLRPMTFEVENLPKGLSLDAATGIISGQVAQAGDYALVLEAKNERGNHSKEFTLKVGDNIALTPPMGWNSWNCWGLSVDADKVKQAADHMVSSGLSQHGWSFVNIDDGWEAPTRDKKGELLGNEKFPDFKSLADYVHKQGLKIGIYSSPGPETCGGYLGSYQYENQDAKTWASWGIDYLKYDWCSYKAFAGQDSSIDSLKAPYMLMKNALDKTNRDIVYSLCQYGWGRVWEWGESVGGNLWRTTGDIVDTWESMVEIGFGQSNNASYAGPGHWNDPDMLIVGWVGWGPNLHPTRLTVNEQYTHISLWCLLSAPLLLG
ncbi:MAG: alpha-galactosidase, partial [Cytophagales bacterium]|nr:alpha-galactosidase [Cytophagales bacterium]